ncbi:MAG: HlyD family efflux transporter periplasmic adaptor subunit [Bacteroidales bacterium]|nr:HlyD family efflux transporter periplasmic adaptor subunit [Bacteroidales bacterium]
MKDRKPEILYSDPVKEIMGNPPRKILRWGTTVMFSIFVLFILFAWLIRYPDTIPAPVEITTENPPVTLVSKITGRIKHLNISDKGKVSKGQVLAVMQTAATINEIEKLRKFTDTVTRVNALSIESVSEMAELGEVQIYYGTFRKALLEYQNFIKNDLYGNKISSSREKLSQIAIYLKGLRQSEKLYSENLVLDSIRHQRSLSLFKADTVIPAGELDKSEQAFLKQKIDFNSIRNEISAKIIDQTNEEELLKEYSLKKTEEMEKLYSSLNESFGNLKAQVKIWENDYLLISPIGGIVTFTKFWSENQSVNKDEPVLAIVPDNPGKYIGRIYLKMQRSGKVKPGQDVNIKLSSYPYLEYGMLKGKIKTKSLVPAGDTYVIEIELPSGLTTLYNRKLEFNQNMQGTAEIITENIRLLQKIVNPFRYLVSKNKR